MDEREKYTMWLNRLNDHKENELHQMIEAKRQLLSEST